MIHVRDGVWEAPGTQRRLAYRLWLPEKPKALVILVHGIWEYVKRYDPIARSLAARGLAIAGQDLWGHGESAGEPGHFDRFGAFVDDLNGITEAVFRPAVTCKRLVVFGHSFGGLIAIHWLLQGSPVQRAVIQSPALGAGVPIPVWKDQIVHGLARCFPRLRVPTGMDPRWISRDPQVVRDYHSDPMIRVRLSARAYQELSRGMREAQQSARQFHTPTLLLLGGSDRVISLDAARQWYAKIPAQKQLKEFPGAYHELHNDSLLQDLSEVIDEWVMG